MSSYANRAPEPVMPRPGRTGREVSHRDSRDATELHAPADGREWHAEWCSGAITKPWRIGWSDGPPDRWVTEDEAEAIAMALRGLGWTEMRRG